jgi:hypothetical protein
MKFPLPLRCILDSHRRNGAGTKLGWFFTGRYRLWDSCDVSDVLHLRDWRPKWCSKTGGPGAVNPCGVECWRLPPESATLFVSGERDD